MSDQFARTPLSRSRLLRLTMKNFRGVRDELSLDFDASAVLLWGPNGTGKTTCLDAVLWLLTGAIPRLGAETMRRNEDYVANTYGSHEPADVTARFIANGSPIVVHRRGTALSHYLELTTADGTKHTGLEADRRLKQALFRTGLSLPEMLRTSGLLQQDDLRLLLRDKPDKRYRQLLRLLGLEALEGFERHTAKRLTDVRAQMHRAQLAAEAQAHDVAQATDAVETARARAANVAPPFDVFVRLRETVVASGGLVAVAAAPSDGNGAAVLAARAAELALQVRSVAGRLNELPETLPVAPDLDSRERERTTISQRLAEATASRETAEIARASLAAARDQFNALAAAALPVLRQHLEGGDSHCPVCQSDIDTASVISSLVGRAGQGSELAAADAVVARATVLEHDLRSQLADVEAALRRETVAREQRQSFLSDSGRILAELAALTSGADLALVPTAGAPTQMTMDPLSTFDWICDNRSPLLSWLDAADTALGAIESAARISAETSGTARLGAERAHDLPRLEARLATLRESASKADADLREARQAGEEIKALNDAILSASGEVFAERFALLQPLINDIYARLDPHPTFGQLDFRVETYRSKGTATAIVADAERELEANPLIVFSSAQANIVVLAVFLSLAVAAGSAGMPFIMMDDPLQAMDDVNVLGFADLSRHLRRQRQIVIATHEERFARLLERKLSGRQTGEDLLVHRFVGWDRHGPQVESRRIASANGEVRLLAP